MDIALLKRVTVEIGNDATIETFELANADKKINETAMLKARTLVAYLWHINKLKLVEMDDWIIGYPDNSPTTALLKTVEPIVCAILPIKFMEKSWNQPGIIAVRNNVEDKAILFDSFLGSSLKWLKDHPQERKMLDNIWGVFS